MNRKLYLFVFTLILMTQPALMASGQPTNPHETAPEELPYDEAYDAHPVWVPQDEDKAGKQHESKKGYRAAEKLVREYYLQKEAHPKHKPVPKSVSKERFQNWYRLTIDDPQRHHVRDRSGRPHYTYIADLPGQQVFEQCDWKSTRSLLEAMISRYKAAKKPENVKLIKAEIARTISTIAFQKADYDHATEIRIQEESGRIRIEYGYQTATGRGTLKKQKISLELGTDTVFKRGLLDAEGNVTQELTCEN